MRSEDISGKRIVSKRFFLDGDVVKIAKLLIGKRLFTLENGIVTGGTITETEAYAGINDKASHAFGGRRTKRTITMFEEGGIAYIYLCYGIHSLFNIVTNKKNIPDAVLIRGISPETGIDKMLKRTGKDRVDKAFANGPGKVAKALGLHYSFSGIPLNKKQGNFKVWVEYPVVSQHLNVKSGKRVGVDYAQEDAKLPYRFYL